jgi:hypothetical protein
MSPSKTIKNTSRERRISSLVDLTNWLRKQLTYNLLLVVRWCHVLRTGIYIYIASSPPLGHHHSYIFTPIHPHSTSTACPGRDKWAHHSRNSSDTHRERYTKIVIRRRTSICLGWPMSRLGRSLRAHSMH